MQIMEARTKNFSEQDVNILLELVKKKVHILECKQTDKITVSAKDKAWTEIEESFNSLTEGPNRNQKVLKTKYFNLKGDFKKRSAAEKRSLYLTGGGPPQKQKKESFDDVLKDIIPEKQIDGLTSIYDCDFVEEYLDFDEGCPNETECNARQVPNSETRSSDVVRDSRNSDSQKDFEHWDSYDSSMLKSERNKKLQFPKSGNSSKTSWSKLAEIKAKWTETKVKQEVEAVKAEHNLRIAQMTSLHELQERLMLEKHELEMKILQKQYDEF